MPSALDMELTKSANPDIEQVRAKVWDMHASAVGDGVIPDVPVMFMTSAQQFALDKQTKALALARKEAARRAKLAGVPEGDVCILYFNQMPGGLSLAEQADWWDKQYD